MRNRNKYKDVNTEIVEHFEKEVFPLYEKCDKGHRMNHINYVIHRSLHFAKLKGGDINPDMLFVAGGYHDVARSYAVKDPITGKDNHHELSAEAFMKDGRMKDFFNEEQIRVIAEAIYDHRASSSNPPRNVYGEIISTADRSTSIKGAILAAYYYRVNMGMDLDSIMEDSYVYLSRKYENIEKALEKSFIYDRKYREFVKNMVELLKDKEKFKNEYLKVIKNN